MIGRPMAGLLASPLAERPYDLLRSAMMKPPISRPRGQWNQVPAEKRRPEVGSESRVLPPRRVAVVLCPTAAAKPIGTLDALVVKMGGKFASLSHIRTYSAFSHEL